VAESKEADMDKATHLASASALLHPQCRCEHKEVAHSPCSILKLDEE
jgi:hypothetical protein